MEGAHDISANYFTGQLKSSEISGSHIWSLFRRHSASNDKRKCTVLRFWTACKRSFI